MAIKKSVQEKNIGLYEMAQKRKEMKKMEEIKEEMLGYAAAMMMTKNKKRNKNGK